MNDNTLVENRGILKLRNAKMLALGKKNRKTKSCKMYVFYSGFFCWFFLLLLLRIIIVRRSFLCRAWYKCLHYYYYLQYTMLV